MSSGRKRRVAAVPLPDGVFRIKKLNGKVYYYHQTGRHLEKALRSPLTRIPFEPREPEFWRLAGELNGKASSPKEGTVKALIAQYKQSSKWAALRPKSQKVYGYYLGLFEEAWADIVAEDLSHEAIAKAREALGLTAPASANLMVRVLRALYVWAIGEGKLKTNPARDVPTLDTDVETTRPWPLAVWQAVVDNGPEDLRRLAVLGRATGQRISDLVRFRPVQRRDDGLEVQIGKLRDKRHFIPLSPSHLAAIDGWNVGPMVPYLTKTNGKRHDDGSLRRRLASWLADEAPEELRGADVSPHGLRAMACCDARLAGREHQEIAALFGMSIAMVERYTKHIDQEALARRARAGMER